MALYRVEKRNYYAEIVMYLTIQRDPLVTEDVFKKAKHVCIFIETSAEICSSHGYSKIQAASILKLMIEVGGG